MFRRADQWAWLAHQPHLERTRDIELLLSPESAMRRLFTKHISELCRRIKPIPNC